ncbi:MAG: bacterial cell division rane protein [Clostridiaceae bacterium]|jgi:cell division protein FtsW (lipid II flippase)|nr:bacterial cell division rane protein [Clostridiaceae bacterium]
MKISDEPKVLKYINEVCNYIKLKDVHKQIKLELENHIEEAYDSFTNEKISHEDAIDKAIKNMGEPSEVGKWLNKVHKAAPEWNILILAITFSCVGLFIMAFMENENLLNNGMKLFSKTLMCSIIGIITAVTLYFYDYKNIKKYADKVFLGVILIMFLSRFFMRTYINGRSWISFGSFTFNIISIGTMFLIPVMAALFDSDKKNFLIYSMVLLLLPISFIIATPDMAVFFQYSVTFAVIAIASKKHIKNLAIPMGILSIPLLFMITESAYRIHRLKSLLIFLNPYKDAVGTGYMNIQLRSIIYSAGMFGNQDKLNSIRTRLPEAHTDFVFGFFIYAFGWIASIALLIAILIFIVKMFTSSWKIRDNYGKLIIIGYSAVFSVQFIWNILTVLGLAPIAGFSLPFISYGGAQLIVDMAAIGLISGIYRRKTVETLLI